MNWFSKKIFNPKALIKVQLTPDVNLNMRFFCQIYLKTQMFFFVEIAKSKHTLDTGSMTANFGGTFFEKWAVISMPILLLTPPKLISFLSTSKENIFSKRRALDWDSRTRLQ